MLQSTTLIVRDRVRTRLRSSTSRRSPRRSSGERVSRCMVSLPDSDSSRESRTAAARHRAYSAGPPLRFKSSSW